MFSTLKAILYFCGIFTAATLIFGAGTLQARPPINDELENAVTVSAPGFRYFGYTFEATENDNEVAASCVFHAGKSVWFRYVPVANGIAVFNSFDSDYDTGISAWTGANHPLTAIACNDDYDEEDNTIRTSQIEFDVEAGVEYFIKIEGYNGGWGEYFLNFSAGPPPASDVAVPTMISPVGDTAVFALKVLTIEWESVATATLYDIQVSDDGWFDSPQEISLSETSHTMSFPQASRGSIFYWRMRARNNVVQGDWSQVRQITVNLTTPSLQFPIAGATVSETIDFQWQSVFNAKHYILQMDDNLEFDSPITREVYQTYYTYNYAVVGKTYYWRVKAVGDIVESAWSEPRILNINYLGPELLQPVSHDMVDAENVLLRWTEVDNSTGYKVQYCPEPDFSQPIEFDVDSDSVYIEHILPGQVYYWRARAYNATLQSEWSGLDSFIVYIEKPQLTGPETGNEISLGFIIFQWQPTAVTDYYFVEYSTDIEFGAEATSSQTVTQHAYKPDDLVVGQTYFWRVKSISSVSESRWSERWSFQVDNSAEQVHLISPDNDAEDVGSSVNFQWLRVDNADEYIFEMLNVSNGYTRRDTIDNSEDDIIGHLVHQLSKNTMYGWKITALKSNVKYRFSYMRYFTTVYDVPGTPELYSPIDDASELPRSLSFSWSSVDYAKQYEIFIYPEDSHTPFYLNSYIPAVTGDTVTINISDFEDGAPYVWKVRAINKTGLGDFSEERSFTIREKWEGPAPALLSPDDLVTGQAKTGLGFSWEKVEEAEFYQFQMFEQKTGSMVRYEDVYFDPELNILSYLPGDLELNSFTTYIWRVRGVNYGDAGQWSEFRSFTTINDIPPAISPVQLYPLKSSKIDYYEFEMLWDTLPNTTYYELWLRDGYELDSTIYENILYSGEDIMRYPIQLTINNIYFWKIRGCNEGNCGPWSSVWGFTTGEGSDIAPITNYHELKLSPVPASDKLTVTMQSHGDGSALFRIYDLNGNLALENRAPMSAEMESKHEIDIRSLTTGSYFLVVYEGDKVSALNFVVSR